MKHSELRVSLLVAAPLFLALAILGGGAYLFVSVEDATLKTAVLGISGTAATGLVGTFASVFVQNMQLLAERERSAQARELWLREQIVATRAPVAAEAWESLKQAQLMLQALDLLTHAEHPTTPLSAQRTEVAMALAEQSFGRFNEKVVSVYAVRARVPEGLLRQRLAEHDERVDQSRAAYDAATAAYRVLTDSITRNQMPTDEQISAANSASAEVDRQKSMLQGAQASLATAIEKYATSADLSADELWLPPSGDAEG